MTSIDERAAQDGVDAGELAKPRGIDRAARLRVLAHLFDLGLLRHDREHAERVDRVIVRAPLGEVAEQGKARRL